ncbi:hypothetical protein GQ600_54 [Phytophthora cactorum]|nr:hypothetical protein GQ600_54 [Phytophthora cactorum]
MNAFWLFFDDGISSLRLFFGKAGFVENDGIVQRGGAIVVFLVWARLTIQKQHFGDVYTSTTYCQVERCHHSVFTSAPAASSRGEVNAAVIDGVVQRCVALLLYLVLGVPPTTKSNTCCALYSAVACSNCCRTLSLRTTGDLRSALRFFLPGPTAAHWCPKSGEHGIFAAATNSCVQHLSPKLLGGFVGGRLGFELPLCRREQQTQHPGGFVRKEDCHAVPSVRDGEVVSISGAYQVCESLPTSCSPTSRTQFPEKSAQRFDVMAGGALLYHQLKLIHCVDLDAPVIPEGWWHQVDSDEFTIAVNYW